jgi:hypothetical protein
MIMKKILTTGTMVCLLTALASAAVIPSGVHNDVSVDTVLNDWGWEIVWQADYSASAPISTVFNGIGAGDYVMLAGLQDGSATFDVLAATSYEDITTYTAQHTTHSSNGAEWYYNGGSMGFAGIGDLIYQNSADVYGTGLYGDPGLPEAGRDRLSWHTSGGYGAVPSSVNSGWRSGDNLNLNGSTTFDKVVLKYTAIPEPASMAMIGIVGIGGWFTRRRFMV